jgi:hypothetical protein
MKSRTCPADLLYRYAVTLDLFCKGWLAAGIERADNSMLGIRLSWL